MIKEAKDIDFYTTGKQPSELDFARISEWIKKTKQTKKSLKLPNSTNKKSTSIRYMTCQMENEN